MVDEARTLASPATEDPDSTLNMCMHVKLTAYTLSFVITSLTALFVIEHVYNRLLP